jgi:uncharacterized cupin superfamily protein
MSCGCSTALDRPMPHSILNLADLDYEPLGHGDRFECRMGEIGGRLGSKKLGYNLTVIPAGKRAFPFHSHRINEEMFFVVEGHGELRIGDALHPIRAGDVIGCPPGGPETAHQLINNSDADLKILAVSTMIWPEIVDYPDSGKFGVSLQVQDGAGKEQTLFRFIGREASAVDYWEGE